MLLDVGPPRRVVDRERTGERGSRADRSMVDCNRSRRPPRSRRLAPADGGRGRTRSSRGHQDPGAHRRMHQARRSTTRHATVAPGTVRSGAPTAGAAPASHGRMNGRVARYVEAEPERRTRPSCGCRSARCGAHRVHDERRGANDSRAVYDRGEACEPAVLERAGRRGEEAEQLALRQSDAPSGRGGERLGCSGHATTMSNQHANLPGARAPGDRRPARQWRP